MRLLNGAFSVPVIALGLFTVGMYAAGCNTGNNGFCRYDQQITCHFADGTTTIRVCPNGIPLCDCMNKFGGIITSAGPAATDSFKNACEDCLIEPCATGGGSGGGSINIDSPYEFYDSKIGGGNEIHPEYPTYYFDKTLLSYDRNSRPVYFEFSVDGYVKSDILTFVLTHGTGTGGTLIKKLTFNNNDLSYTTFLRRFSSTPPIDCDGVVKMEMMSVFTPSGIIAGTTYNIEMRKNGTYAIDKDFEVVVEDGTPAVDWRKLRIDMLYTVNSNASPTKTYDIQSYKIGSGTDERAFEEAISYVFEKGKANIIYFTNPAQTLLGANWVDADADIMLDRIDLPNNGTDLPELIDACSKWTEKVYKAKVNAIYDNSAFGVEINSLKSYDFSNLPAVSVATNNATVISNTYGASGHFNGLRGISLPKDLSGNFSYRGAIVFRKETIKFRNLLSSTAQSSIANSELKIEQNLALQTFLHEMGHIWSNAAWAQSAIFSCGKHINKGSGRNFDGCLWQTPCKAATDDAFWIGLMNDPKYCESHLQIFMNQLKIK